MMMMMMMDLEVGSSIFAFHSLSRFSLQSYRLQAFTAYDRCFMEISALMNACTLRYNFSKSQVMGRFFGIKLGLLPDVVPCMCIVRRRPFFQTNKIVEDTRSNEHGVCPVPLHKYMYEA